ncbi:MAG: glycosyltransferase [Actinomycetota bacterium]|nr:glycosyltransferase [Actinomycetota bacterium]
MNVYVRELATAIARAGVDCDVYTRAWQRGLPSVVSVEPGFRVHHVPAGPAALVARRDLPDLVAEFTDGVLQRMIEQGAPDLIHANYWLSGVAGHDLKHNFELPLISTFHTLARVKAEADPEEHERRAEAEARTIGCSDAILASSPEERAQLEELYGADRDRVEIVPPGVDHDVFSPGEQSDARRALGLGGGPLLLFVGRIQPLKGAAVAIEALARLPFADATLVIVGGPSGPEGNAEMRRLRRLVVSCGVQKRVRFVAAQPHEHLAVYYRAADVCLVPSHSESFGLVALEAAACGTPVIAAAVGGLATIVDDGRTGFLVEDWDPASFAGYATELLDHPARAAQMATAASIEARRYRWSITAARLRRLYNDLAERRLVECP